MITDVTPEDVFEYLNEQIKQLQNRLVSKYGSIILSNGNLQYYVDEEDGFLEYLSHEMASDLGESDEPLIKILSYWTNERKVYPKAWIIWAWNQLINKENEIK